MHLALDSALGSGSAAVCAGGKLLAHQEIAGKGMQAKLLVSTIEQVLALAGVGYEELDSIICTTGPGTFTGIRIALATARAIGFTAHKPVKGVSTLACIAYGFGAPCMAILPAGKDMVYAQHFSEKLQQQSDAVLISNSELSTVNIPIVTATVSDLVDAEQCIAQKIALNAALIGKLAMDAQAAHLLTAPDPLYIRPPDITTPKTKIA
jgi:tRNA threonylcarbamoyladenosine biosynthesis protein TsaB